MADLFGKNVNLDVCAMHVAPGGSLIVDINGNKKIVGALLSELREEIAYGMVAVDAVNDNDVHVAIYYGNADDDALKDVCSRNADFASLDIKRTQVAENEKRDALSMASRNQVINALM